MAVAFDAASTGAYSAAATTLAWSHTVGAGADALIVFVGFFTAGQTVSGITYGGASLSFSHAETDSPVRVEVWYLKNPTAGTATITVTPSASTTLAGGGVSYSGVKLSTSPFNEGVPVGTIHTPPDAVPSHLLNISSVTDNNWIVDGLASTSTGLVVVSPYTQRVNSSGALGSLGISDKGPDALGPTTVDWHGQSNNDTWAITAGVLDPTLAGFIDASGLSGGIPDGTILNGGLV